MRQIRTDLALEAAEYHRQSHPGDLPGLREREETRHGLSAHWVEIESDEAARALEKPVGHYLTLDLSPVLRREADAFPRAVHALSECLTDLLPVGPNEPVLVAGLGNRMVTPDAIGPRAADQMLVTRHLIREDPDRFAPFRPVSALSAGVLGTTGMESGEVIQAVAGQIQPGLVIAIDALAARSASRLCATVQVGDSGIVPGSGIGNARAALNRETLGVPVLAIGVPTVIDAATLAADLTGQAAGEGLSALLVTPKDIDTLISDAAKVIAYAVNLALQPGLEIADVELFLS